MSFNSQICTTREQSERLLSLGLKKETADMTWQNFAMTEEYEDWKAVVVEEWDDWCNNDIPAWSLHRLWDILPKDVEVDDDRYVTSHLEGEKAIVYHDYGSHYYNFDKNNIYDNIVNCIEWLIKEGYFNKEYLN